MQRTHNLASESVLAQQLDTIYTSVLKLIVAEKIVNEFAQEIQRYFGPQRSLAFAGNGTITS